MRICTIGITSSRFLSKFYCAEDNTYEYTECELDNCHGNLIFKVYNEEGQAIYELSSNMMFEEETNLYYKVITNIEEFNMYKEKIKELPNMLEADFSTKDLIIIGKSDMQMIHERDLEISKINSDEATTYITLKQKENPDYDKRNLMLYKIVDKSLVKENIKLSIEQFDMTIDGFESIEKLPDNYSAEDAIKDGCFVVEYDVILSKNKNAIDEFLEKTKSGIETSLRIYLRYTYSTDVRIIDMKYINGIYMWKERELTNPKTFISSSKYMNSQIINDYFHMYSLYNVLPEEGEGCLFLEVQKLT